MKRFSYWKRGAVCLAPLLAVLWLASLWLASPVQAQGGFALSGSFYQQNFEIPQGSSVSGPDIYVVVFNQSDDGESGVRMTAQTPLGVKINLSQNDFTLPAGGQQKVLIGVEVTKDAAPGKYELSVTAESYKKGDTGIQLTGAAGQTARLTVLGESGTVKVQVLSPEGQPLVSTVRLYRVMASQNYEVAFSETGTLETKVAPGSFIAATYIGGEKRAEESFTVAAGENKTITLSAATIYFEGFGIVPNYQKESGKLASAQIVYTVRNLYKQVTRADVILDVSRDGVKIEEIPLATLSPLDIGRAGLNYNYMPSGGWTNGVYSFKLVLKLDGEPYATSFDEAFDVTTSVVPTRGINLVVFSGGIIAGVALITFCVGLFILRKHRV